MSETQWGQKIAIQTNTRSMNSSERLCDIVCTCGLSAALTACFSSVGLLWWLSWSSKKIELRLKSMIVFRHRRERERERECERGSVRERELLTVFFLTHLNPHIYTSGPTLCRIIQSHRLTTVPHTRSLAGYQGDREERSMKWSNGLALFIYLQANGFKQ